MKKLGGRKSHHGCRLCKRRRVKCDEVRPSCGHCFRRGELCEYSNLAVRQSRQSSNTISRASEPDCVALPSTFAECSPDNIGSPFGVTPNATAAYISRTSLQDLKLLHVYVSNASNDFFGSKALSSVWHDIVPKIGFDHPFVLHGILAVAAFQCAYGEASPPSSSPYHAIGVDHYAAALPLFRDAVANINESNCNAVLAFSMLAPGIAFSLCSAISIEDVKSQNIHRSLITDVTTIISLLKGIDAIIASFRETIANGPLSSILQWDANPPAKTLTRNDQTAIEALDRIVLGHCSGQRTYGGVHVDYQILAHNIRESFLESGTNAGDRAVRVKWMMRVPPGFIEAIQAHDVLAHVMFAALGVLLDGLRENWWCENTGRNLIAAVCIELESVVLSSDVELLLQWARHSVEIP